MAGIHIHITFGMECNFSPMHNFNGGVATRILTPGANEKLSFCYSLFSHLFKVDRSHTPHSHFIIWCKYLAKVRPWILQLIMAVKPYPLGNVYYSKGIQTCWLDRLNPLRWQAGHTVTSTRHIQSIIKITNRVFFVFGVCECGWVGGCGWGWGVFSDLHNSWLHLSSHHWIITSLDANHKSYHLNHNLTNFASTSASHKTVRSIQKRLFLNTINLHCRIYGWINFSSSLMIVDY